MVRDPLGGGTLRDGFSTVRSYLGLPFSRKIKFKVKNALFF